MSTTLILITVQVTSRLDPTSPALKYMRAHIDSKYLHPSANPNLLVDAMKLMVKRQSTPVLTYEYREHTVLRYPMWGDIHGLADTMQELYLTSGPKYTS